MTQEFFVEQIAQAAKLAAEKDAPLVPLIEKAKFFVGKGDETFANPELELLILGNILYQN